MKLFNTLCLEITSVCNRKCGFCPVAYNSRPDERMDESLLVKALTELGGLGYRGRIEFYVYNEPLRDREYLLHATALARRLVPKSCLMIATNGDYLRGPDDIMSLFDAGLNQILINCYSPGLYARRRPWVDTLPSSVSHTRGVYSALPPSARSIEMLDKSDPDKFGDGVFGLINRAGNVPAFRPATDAPVDRMCVKPFRLLNINWRGEALLCCNDYHGDVVYGTLGDSTLVELWNHPVLVTYRRKLLAKDRSLPLCRHCDCHSGAYPGNVCSPAPTAEGASPEDVERLYEEGLSRRGAGVRSLPVLPQGG